MPQNNSIISKYRSFNIDNIEEAKDLLKNNKIDFSQVSKRLSSNKEFVIFSLNLGVCAYIYLTEDLQRDPEIIKSAVKYYPSAIKNAPDSSISDRSFIKEVLSINGTLLSKQKLAQYKDDREMVATAIKNAGISIIYASNALKSNIPFVLQAMKDPRMPKALRIEILDHIHPKFKDICKGGDPLDMIQKHYDTYLLAQKLNDELTIKPKEDSKLKI